MSQKMISTALNDLWHDKNAPSSTDIVVPEAYWIT